MGKAYSEDLRARLIEHVAAGGTRRGAARRFGVSPSCAVKLVRHVERTGSTAPARRGRPAGGGKLAAHMATLIRWVEAMPDITMPELAAKLMAATGATAHPASLSRALLNAGYSFKKNAAGIGMRTR
jgi:transposase